MEWFSLLYSLQTFARSLCRLDIVQSIERAIVALDEMAQSGSVGREALFAAAESHYNGLCDYMLATHPE